MKSKKEVETRQMNLQLLSDFLVMKCRISLNIAMMIPNVRIILNSSIISSSILLYFSDLLNHKTNKSCLFCSNTFLLFIRFVRWKANLFNVTDHRHIYFINTKKNMNKNERGLWKISLVISFVSFSFYFVFFFSLCWSNQNILFASSESINWLRVIYFI